MFISVVISPAVNVYLVVCFFSDLIYFLLFFPFFMAI